jgi:hypothetical protein
MCKIVVVKRYIMAYIVIAPKERRKDRPEKGRTMKLRNMSAEVTEENSVMIELASGEVLELENALVLHSYSSRVAVYCKMRVYLLPRYDYSVTTWKHVHAFIQDYCSFVNDYSASHMRAIAREGVYNTEKEYAFAAGIVDGVPVRFCNCEGCANFGNVECERLCSLTYRLSTY